MKLTEIKNHLALQVGYMSWDDIPDSKKLELYDEVCLRYGRYFKRKRKRKISKTKQHENKKHQISSVG